MPLHLIRQHRLLLLGSMLEELLDHVVTEDIGHELQRIGLQLPEDLLLFVAVGRLKLLLDETRPVLIAAELDDVIVNVLVKC